MAQNFVHPFFVSHAKLKKHEALCSGISIYYLILSLHIVLLQFFIVTASAGNTVLLFSKVCTKLTKKKEHIQINFSALKILSHLQGGKSHIFNVKMKGNISAISVKSGSR